MESRQGITKENAVNNTRVRDNGAKLIFRDTILSNGCG